MQTAYFKLIRGDTETLGFTVTDENGTRLNLNSITATLSIKRRDADAGSLLVKKFVAPSPIPTPIVDLTNGYFEFVLTKTDTQINPGRYKFDVQIDFPNGTRKTSIGDVDVVGDLTK